jgi:hypothetical protein
MTIASREARRAPGHVTRAIRSLFAAILASALVASSAISAAQEVKRPTVLPVPRDGKPWRIERTADIPESLKSAIERTHCHLEEQFLHETPIEIFQPGRSVIAIVPCWAIVIGYGRAFVFERNQDIEPKPILFPVLAAPSGFGTSETPGWLTWDRDSKLLTAMHGNDIVGGEEMRHTYRYDPRQANFFTLIRIETRKCCHRAADEAWTPIWDAQAWPKLHL